MTNSADPDQLASDLDLHCLQRQGISGSSRTRVNVMWKTMFDHYHYNLKKNNIFALENA